VTQEKVADKRAAEAVLACTKPEFNSRSRADALRAHAMLIDPLKLTYPWRR